MKVGLLLLLILNLNLLSKAETYSRFEENGKFGIKDVNGKIVVSPYYDELGWSDKNFSVVNQVTGYFVMGRWGLLNIYNKRLTPPLYETLKYSGGVNVIASKLIDSSTQKFGCINLQGKILIPFQYDQIAIEGNIATVNKDSLNCEYGLVNLYNGLLIPPIYKNIVPLDIKKYAVTNNLNKVAIFDSNGTRYTDFIFDSIEPFHNCCAIAKKNGLIGLIDSVGVSKLEPKYKSMEWKDKTHLSACKLDNWLLLDSKNKIQQQIDADSLACIESGWFKRIINNRQGLVDNNFQMKWPSTYEYIGNMDGNLIVAKSGNYGIVDINQKIVIPFEYDTICFETRFIRAHKTIGGISEWELFSVFGTKMDRKKYEQIEGYNGRYFPVKYSGKWGGIDVYGVEILDCNYDSIISQKGGLSVVMVNNKYLIISSEGKQKLSPSVNQFEILNHNRYLERSNGFAYLKDFYGKIYYFSNNPITALGNNLLEQFSNGQKQEINFDGYVVRSKPLPKNNGKGFSSSEGLIGMKRNGKYGFVDSKGRLVIANRYENIGEFHEGMAQIMLLSKWGYINRDEQIMVQPTYDKAENFYFGLAIVTSNNKVGVINKKGESILSLKYDSIKRTPDNHYVLSINLLKGLADEAGRLTIEPRFEQLMVTKSGMVLVSRSGLWGVLNYNGNDVIPIQYQSIKYLEEKDMFLVKSKSHCELLEIIN